jgi:hypothetical protein
MNEIIMEYKGVKFKIVNAYLSPKPKLKSVQMQELSEITKGKDNIIIGGDLNSITELSQRACIIENQGIDKEFIKFIHENNLIDMPVDRGVLNPTYVGRSNAALLDRFLISPDINKHVFSYKIITCPFSDHDAIAIELFETIPNTYTFRNKSYWKLNTSLLNSEENYKIIENVWEEWKLYKGEYNDIRTWWDKGKVRIKKAFIEIGVKEAKSRRNKKREIAEAIDNEMNKRELNYNKLIEMKAELNKVMEYEIEGAKIRSRQLTLPHEEKGSKNFYNLETKNRIKEQILELKDNGKEIFKAKDIKEYIHSYYSQLYTLQGSDPLATEMLANNMEMPALTKNEKINLNSFIKGTEIYNALKSMKNPRAQMDSRRNSI